MTRRSLPILLAVLIARTSLAAEVEPARESAASGSLLPVETVTALLQDHAGFLWVGSREGLILYDGYTSTTFEHDVSDPASLSDNDIRVLFEDSRGRLWIGTNSGGLNELDRGSWKFRSFRHDSQNATSISNDSIYAIVEDRDGRLWIGTQNGLDRFDPATGRFETVSGLSHPYVDALYVDSRSRLWIGTVGGGLNRLDLVSGAITIYDTKRIAADSVYAIVEDGAGGLYLGTVAGIVRIDPESDRLRQIPFRNISSPEDVLVTYLARAPDGTLWAGTFEQGLWSLPRGSGTFVPSSAVKARRVQCILATPGGHIWVGTWDSGLLRVSGAERFMTPGPPLDAAAVLEDRAGRLWAGESRALVRRDASGKTLSIDALNGAVALGQTRDGHVLVGTFREAAEVDPSTGRLLWIANGTDPKAVRIGPGWIWSFLEDHAGRLWIATGGGGLFRRRDDGTFDRFRHDPADPGSLSDDYLVTLIEGRDGTLWIGTRSGGLNVLPPGASSFTRCEPDGRDPRSLSHHSVLSLLEGSDGTIWAGTGGGGLDRVDRGADGSIRFTRFTENDGLIDDNVVSLVEDDDGSLWVGTRRGLSRFEPRSKRFFSYGADDGLPSIEFAKGAATRGRRSLFFGTHRGVVAVPRGEPFPTAAASPTLLTSVRTLTGAVAASGPPWSASRIEIPYGESLTFGVTVLDYRDRRRHRYAYRLDGLSKTWVDLGTRREVTLTHLGPGTYVLHAKGRNDQGVWSETPVALAIRVVPPFWMTTWFRLACAIGVVAAGFGVHRMRTASLTRRNRELVTLQEQRERAQKELTQAYARLRGLTRRMEEAKEDERKRISRELHDEMGQILTTAKLNLQLVGERGGEEHDRRVGDAIALIDRLIGHVRALSLRLRPPLLDDLGLTAALRAFVESQQHHSRLPIVLDARAPCEGLPAEVEIAAFRVVQEAITNVLRHAGAGRAEVGLRYEPDWLAVTIVDDGVGFDVPATLERASDGRHLGLAGMKERVESMGGTVTITSSPAAGTTIAVRLPWKR